MAANFAIKQAGFLARFTPAVTDLLANADKLTVLCNEFTVNQYGSGGANALTDAVVQGTLPATTAAQVFFAVGQLANASAILAQIAAARAGLEALRP